MELEVSVDVAPADHNQDAQHNPFDLFAVHISSAIQDLELQLQVYLIDVFYRWQTNT